MIDRRLFAWFCTLSLLAVAALYVAPAQACIPGGAGIICNSRAQADAYVMANSEPSSLGPVVVAFEQYGPALFTSSGHPLTGNMIAGRVQCGVQGYPYAGCNAGPPWVYWLLGPTDEQCEARNSDPEQAPGPRLTSNPSPSGRCVGGCMLEPGAKLEEVSGRVQGNPTTFYRFAQSYTTSCDTEQPPEETDFTEADDNRQCNPDLGVCIDDEGNNEYCTFNPDGTPSTCVPAVDYDDDGVPDDDDVAPGDPSNGDDKEDGNESDNRASGGASCASPPSCSGDGIACSTLFQTWKARCELEKVNAAGIKVTVVAGGTGPGTDPGEDDDCATWDTNCNGIPDDVETPYDEAQEGVIGDAVVQDDSDAAWGLIDGSGFLGGSSCPGIVTGSYMGHTFNVNTTVCQIASAFAALVLMVAYAMAAGIVARAASGS